MDKISKGFVGRTVRAVLFIILIIVFCTAISSAGIYLASRCGLTQVQGAGAADSLFTWEMKERWNFRKGERWWREKDGD